MGQNGAGKSTLIKLLTGVHRADSGVILMDGNPVRPRSPAHAQELGISTVYQEVNLCPNLTIAENIYAGRYRRHTGMGLWRIDWRRHEGEAKELLARLHLNVDVRRVLGECSVAVQQLVAIARALAVSARVLILDEPTSSLDADEVQQLFGVMRRLRDEGLAILFVSHFLDQVYEVSDRITVLRNGERVGEYAKQDLPPAALIRAMVGRDVATEVQRETSRRAATAAPLVQARQLGRRGLLRPCDLELNRGEVLGLGGLLGSGRTELARLLFGLEQPDTGALAVKGQALRLTAPIDAMRAGFAMCPEERKAEGIVGALSVRENILLALQARSGLWRHARRSEQARVAQALVDALGIKTASLETPVEQLSGGNQQKVVLARCLALRPEVLILDEPTRGIDVAAKQEIMQKVLEVARDGVAVLFISSELDEVVRVSDRVVVMKDRGKLGELAGGSTENEVYRMIAAEAA